MMRLLNYDEHGELGINSFDESALPPYAILSHTWGSDADEVTFADLIKGYGNAKHGYKKILFCGQQAQRDDLRYFWIDTCCIDKADKSELSHAIRSMFHWYQNAARCYVYLSDVSTTERTFHGMLGEFTWEPAFRTSRWFTRGWTLQELLAPSIVEFFSREEQKLGDKRSLKSLIHQITSISLEALDGAPLSHFSVNERLRWKEGRVTKREEDGAYSLQGILDVELAPVYGEGAAGAFGRLRDEIRRLERCVQELYNTDPRDDKKRIEETKGGLLVASYRWVLDNTTFRRWRQVPHHRVLWVKGDPGKGKTMLLCGIINELHCSLPRNALLSYFFCQATDSRINNATAVLRGLLYMLALQQPSILSHIRKRHDQAGKDLFDSTNAWIALTEIFANVLRDRGLRDTYIVIDALDECITGRPKLLSFIASQSSASQRVKWIVSGRNWIDFETQLERAGHNAGLSLELNAKSEATTALALFTQQKVDQLTRKGQYEVEVQHAVLQHLLLNANGTFLWVMLVCQDLASTPKSKVLEKLASIPPGLDALYQRMLRQIIVSDGAEICRRVLASVAVFYRPVTISELVALVEPFETFVDNARAVQDIVSLCGSFIILREDTIYFVHQSAKDFICTIAFDVVFPDGVQAVHRAIFSRSLATLFKTLHKDMYDLEAPGFASDDVKPPDPDPLATSRYSCIHWVDHLFHSKVKPEANSADVRQLTGLVTEFLEKKYLYWLEGLSLCRRMAKGVLSMSDLLSLVQDIPDADNLTRLVQDACRFLTYHKRAIEICPLQTYVSALLFSPTGSLVRKMFQHEEPKWVVVQPTTGDSWDACLQTFEGHSDIVTYVTFLFDGKRLASMSWDGTIKIWDLESGELQASVESHDGLMDFSQDGKRLASCDHYGNFSLWDTESGAAVAVLESHGKKVTTGDGQGAFRMSFSHDSKMLASGLADKNVSLWNAGSGEAIATLQSYGLVVRSVTFSLDDKRLAVGLDYGIITLWNVESFTAIATLKNRGSGAGVVRFSPDSKRLASSLKDKDVALWNVETGTLVATLQSQSSPVFSPYFSPDSKRLVFHADDGNLRLWDAESGAAIAVLAGHGQVQGAGEFPMAFSHNSKLLVSGSEVNNVRLWNAESGAAIAMLKTYGVAVLSVAFSPDGKKLVAGLDYGIIQLWDVASSTAIATLRNHSIGVLSVVFSPNSKQLASGSWDRTVRLWDVESCNGLTKLEDLNSSVRFIAFSPDGEWLAAGSNDCTISLQDAKSGDVGAILKGHSECITSLAFSPNSKLLASASRDRSIKLWDVESRAEVARFYDHSANHCVTAIAFSPDGKQLVLGSGDCYVRVVSAKHGEVGKLCATLGSNNSVTTSFAFSPDGKRFIAGAQDSIFSLWHLSPTQFSLKAPALREKVSEAGSYANSNTGIVRVDSDAHLTHEECDLFVAKEWIMLGSQRLLWLPPDYRAICNAISGWTMALGHNSGRVSHLRFDFLADDSRNRFLRHLDHPPRFPLGI